MNKLYIFTTNKAVVVSLEEAAYKAQELLRDRSNSPEDTYLMAISDSLGRRVAKWSQEIQGFIWD